MISRDTYWVPDDCILFLLNFSPFQSFRQRNANRCGVRQNSSCFGAITHTALLRLIRNETFGLEQNEPQSASMEHQKLHEIDILPNLYWLRAAQHFTKKEKTPQRQIRSRRKIFSPTVLHFFFCSGSLVTRRNTDTHTHRAGAPSTRFVFRFCGMLSAISH